MSVGAGLSTEAAPQLSAASSASGPVMVVGMHRSGTSFLTGSLQLAGLELGKHSAWNPFNTKGNRENDDFVAFHDAVLAARGAAWDVPPAEIVEWTPAEREQAQALVSGYDGVARWGFKDPRALLMVEAWRTFRPNICFVGIFRHPEAVAVSLVQRSKLEKGKAYALWSNYNKRLLALHKHAPFPLLCFDEEETVLREKLNAVLTEVGLNPLTEEHFYASELQHHRHGPEDIPSGLCAIYGALIARSR